MSSRDDKSSRGDFNGSELITKSLSGALSDGEKKALEDYVTDSKEAKAFSSLSALIDKSVVDFTNSSLDERRDIAEENGLSEDEARLSQVAKERMRRSIRKAKVDSLAGDVTSASKVAEQETAYFVSSQAEEELVEVERHAVARFTLQQKIGEGGLGRVWLARDEKLKRNVAIKEMTEEAAASPKMAQRFQREAEITAHLEHPNVVPLYLSGVNPNTGLPFYAMRFLGKRTLSEAIREYHARRRVGADDSVDLLRLLNAFLDVCQAIAYAHSRGVIHRDLKPENVALDSFGQVLVLDWGLAKLDGDGELTTRLALSGQMGSSVNLGNTVQGDIVGTPMYMSPEQAAGKLDEVDSRTDVYGLGAILFAILTGEAPHEASKQSSKGTLRVKEFLEVISKAETPSARAVNGEVPRDLELICQRAMAGEKFARHGGASELASEVENWLAGKREKEANFDRMYMAARDLKSRLCVQLRQLVATSQFMVELPPIQGLLSSIDGEQDEFSTWRVRLAQILLALARTKPTVSGLSYSRIEDDRINELVRIERSLQDVANVRTLPLSRLRKGVASTFHQVVLQQFPGESSIDFDCATAGTVRLVCGVPVFSDQTEEPFGLVCTEAEIGNLVRPELDMIGTRDRVFLIDDNDNVLFSNVLEREAKSLAVEELIPVWPQLKKTLNVADEYRDPNREHYAVKLELPQKYNSVRIVFQSAE